MTTKYTEQDALAYVMITGTTKALHESTLKAIKPSIREAKDGRIELKDVQDTAKAMKSRLWKAHAWLEGQKYSLNEFTGPGQLVYTKRGARAETGRHGAVFVRGNEAVRYLNG